MDVQAVLDTATAVNAANLGSSEASAIFRDSLKNSRKVLVNLKRSDRNYLQRVCTYPLVFTNQQSVTNDHPVLVAMRNLIRDVYEDEFKPSLTGLRTLVVGASARELRKYNSNPHISYFIHGKEGKDVDRIIRPALEDILKQLRAKASKTDRQIFLPPVEPGQVQKQRPVVKRYHNLKTILDDYVLLNKMPSNIHLQPVDSDVLLFEDTIYNFGEEGIVELFRQTGAKVAYGYALLPNDLIYQDMPRNPLYRFWVDREPRLPTLKDPRVFEEYANFTFTNGYCNGYRHLLSSWSAILSKPALVGDGIAVGVEITSRVGPMAAFKLYRTTYPEQIVRTVSLQPHERFVKLLDIHASCDSKTGRVCSKLEYFSMREEEFTGAINYALALDVKSLTFSNVLAYIRRRAGGMSLVTKELTEPWQLPGRSFAPAALAILVQSLLFHEKSDLMLSNLKVTSITERLLVKLRAGIRLLFLPVSMVLEWVFQEHLTGKIVLYPDGDVFQRISVSPAWKRERDRVAAFSDPAAGPGSDEDSGDSDGTLVCPIPEWSIAPSFPNEEEVPSCHICADYKPKSSRQVVRCDHVDDSLVTFKLSDEQVARLKMSLVDTDNDPVGLKKVKEDAAAVLPKTGFEHKCHVYYIRGGPGCGKSHFIRAMATEADLVMAPFSKLKPDYENVVQDGRESIDLLFKTTHRALQPRGKRRIFLDEFTSMPYEMLAVAAYNNGAEEIYLVGDEKQTKVREPEEGMYIGNHIDLGSLSKHTLMVNFRNPRDTVALLNKLYGYEMTAASEIERSIEIVDPDNVPDLDSAVRMSFTKISAKMCTGSAACTVRSNQGGTSKNVVLFANVNDGQTTMVEELQIVAISRHTTKLVIVSDGSLHSKAFLEKLGLNQDFYDTLTTWLHFELGDAVEKPDESLDVELVLKPPQPARDSYLLLDTFTPPVASDPDITSMNDIASQVVQDSFSSGTSDTDFLTPVNERGHPVKLIDKYYCAGPGFGNHYTSKKPMQTLQVLSARYLNKVPHYALGDTEETLAQAMVKAYVEEHMEINMDAMVESAVASMVQKFLVDVCKKQYQQQFVGLDNPDIRVIRFNLKGIFKPAKLRGFDEYKPGQGISAWSRDACTLFGATGRLLGKHMKMCEKPHVVSDAYRPDKEFMALVKKAFGEVPEVAMNGVTDGEMFDANQNKFTQLIERLMWEALGVASEFLDLYYSFRNSYTIQAPGIRGTAGSQKTSGEPLTLENNGIVAKVISNWVLRGQGPVALVYKGDDFTKRQCCLHIDEDRLAKVHAACPLRLKVSIQKNAEFCGLSMVEGELVPSIPRKVCKLQAHRFRDYEHFCEYQASLRDWLNLVEVVGTETVITVNSELYATSEVEMRCCYDVVASTAHINKEQWLSKWKYVEEYDNIPSGSNNPEGVDFRL